MYEAGKAAQIAAEITAYKLSFLGLCETRWIESGCIQLSTGQTVLYSGHDDANAPHTEGIGFMLTPQSCQVTHRLEPRNMQDRHSKVPRQGWKSHHHPVVRTNQRS